MEMYLRIFVFMAASGFYQSSASLGTFEIHIKNYTLYPSIDFKACCPPNSGLEPKDCAQYCQIHMEICLTVYQRNPHHYECDIGENKIVTDVLGNYILNNASLRDYSIIVKERWKQKFNLLVKIVHGSVSKNSHPMVTISAGEESVKPGRSWISKELSNTQDRFQLHVSYRYMCAEFYYGNECDHICRPTSSEKGHYSCSEHGERICHAGYNGTYCDQAVCQQNECVHGTCVGPNVCRCLIGWTERTCNTCIPYPGCVHGKCRIDPKTNESIALSCDCEKGWGGMFCNIDLNYCKNNSHVCMNGGQCQNFGNIDTNQQYRCACKDGFAGNHCEKIVSDCKIRPCLNDGVCQVVNATKTAKCLCKSSFYGDRCQFNQTSCDESPCLGINSVCHKDPEFGFRCQCATGFSGRNCEIDQDECIQNPCLNNGMCIDRPSGYLCVCPVGFSGTRCQVNKNDCQKLSCMNGGRCIDRANRVECRCTTGWTGKLCNLNIDECAINQPCVNGGKCVDTPGSFKCNCPSNWSGIHCELKIINTEELDKRKKCPSNVCHNNGQCYLIEKDPKPIENLNQPSKEFENSFVCKCLPGFTGKLCREVIVSNISNSHIDINNNHETGFTTAIITYRNLLSESTLRIAVVCIIVISVFAIIILIVWMYFKTYRSYSSKQNKKKSMTLAEKTNIKILNNKLSRLNSISDSLKKEKIPLSTNLLNNQLPCSDANGNFCHHNFKSSNNNNNGNLYTYKCSGIKNDTLLHIDNRFRFVQNPQYLLTNLNELDHSDNLNSFFSKSCISVAHKEAEPESIYSIQNANLNKDCEKIHMRSSLESNLHKCDDVTQKLFGSSNSAMLNRKKENSNVESGLCSSQTSLVEVPMKSNLRASLSQQFYQPFISVKHDEIDSETMSKLFIRKCPYNAMNYAWPIYKCSFSPTHQINPNNTDQHSANRILNNFVRSPTSHKINYNLVSNPNFKETPSFYNNSGAIYQSVKSVDTTSTLMDDPVKK